MSKKLKERSEALARAQEIVDRAKAASRELTPAEQAEIEAKFEQVKSIDAWLKGAEESDALMARMKQLGAPIGDGDRDRLVGPLAVDSRVKGELASALRRKSAYAFDMPFSKAAITAGGVNLPGTGTLTSESLSASAAVSLRDLFQVEQANSGNVRYYTVGAGTADVVAEGATKPDLGASITPHDDALQKVAAVFSYTDELAEDAGFLLQYIGREAMKAVLVKENALIVSALGSATGIATSTGTDADVFDVLAGAIATQQAANGLTPAALIANPIDVGKMRTVKSTGSGELVLDPLATAPASVYGVPLTASAAVTAGTMFLVSDGAGVFYTRGGLRVESGFTGDDFITNKVTTRVEERVLPAIIRPALVTEITLTAV